MRKPLTAVTAGLIFGAFLGNLARPAVAEAPNGPPVQSFALQIRSGSILWSGMDWPQSTNGGTTNINGINGKNFLYPVMPMLGAGGRIILGQGISLNPSLDVFVDEYVYRSDFARAFRTTRETGIMVGPVATVMGLLVGVPVWFDIPFDQRLALALSPGLSFFPRFAVAALDNSSGIDKITESLNSEAQWLYPTAGLEIKYLVTSGIAAGLQVQALIPIYHAWSTNGLAFQDGLMVTGMFAFDFYF